MSPEIEDFFCSGKNQEHSSGAVHQTKLEVLFKVFRWWAAYVKAVKDRGQTIIMYNLYQCMFFSYIM